MLILTLIATLWTLAAAAPLSGLGSDMPPPHNDGSIPSGGRAFVPRKHPGPPFRGGHRSGGSSVPFTRGLEDGAADPPRSLALVPADPSSGETAFEAAGGVHPYQLCDSDEEIMYMNLYFCAFSGGEAMTYVTLPWYIVDTENAGVRTDCPATKEECRLMGLTDLGLESCLWLCGNYLAPEGAACSEDVLCDWGHFCYRGPGDVEGTCGACPDRPEDCLLDDTMSQASKKSCLECDIKCHYLYWGDLTVEGESYWTYALGSSPFYSSPGEAVGPLVECSDLVLDSVDVCPNAQGAICLIEDYVKDSFYHMLAQKCEASGGLAMILYFSAADEDGLPDDVPGESWLSVPVHIPAVRVAYDVGVMLRENKLGVSANVTTYDAGSPGCWIDQYCSTTVPCMSDGYYCYFAEGKDEGHWCDECPEDPAYCFFPIGSGDAMAQSTIESCAKSCAAEVEFGGSCKMCGEGITAFEFGVDDPSERCVFCPEDEAVPYPERTFPPFSTWEREIKCWQVRSFFNDMEVPRDSKNCQLAQNQNYICGCTGVGYAGANTQAKQNALVWVPRVTAILSSLGSLFVLIDVLKTKQRRESLFHQLMAQMSIFDLMGSVAYALTSLPIPSSYHIQGAQGNVATCTFQGFFIQVGTVACFTNVSLAFYYFFIIQKGWSETRLKKIRIWLFICPIAVGLAFACAGFPFYDNMLLWCNNSAAWWPDIPVAIAIVIATAVMGSVCWDVHKKHQASNRWRQGGTSGGGNSLSMKVFWQSFWYLMAFYMTWPPYLALQYMWAAGEGYGNYGFILYAGSVVPLQGVWNFFVYARNRQLKSARERAASFVSAVASSIMKRLSSSGIKAPNKEEGLSTSMTQNPTTQNLSQQAGSTAQKTSTAQGVSQIAVGSAHEDSQRPSKIVPTELCEDMGNEDVVVEKP